MADVLAGCTAVGCKASSTSQSPVRKGCKRGRSVGDDGGEDALCAKLVRGCSVGRAADGTSGTAVGEVLRRSGARRRAPCCGGGGGGGGQVDTRTGD